MYFSFEQTWERKIDEVFLTLELEVHYRKAEILEGYLNSIYYDNSSHGEENAQVTSVLVDPNTGGIITLTGGLNYSESTYNRVKNI